MAEQGQTPRVFSVWKNLTPGQRIMVGGTIAAVIIAVVVGAWVISRAGYSVLYSGLAPEEAGQIVEKLEQRNIPYRLAGGGGTILVPSSKVYDARIELASEGYPRSGTVGFEIFDKTVFGMTEFLQKVNYRRALEGELAKTIMQMDEVEGVRVHIVVPEKSLFKEDQQAATASVVLKTNPASSLSRKHVEGIAYLVASAVEGLDPERVTILDSKGTLLSKGFFNGQGQPGDALELKQQVEAYLEGKAQTLLDGVLGPGKSIVRVAAELNLERIERTIQRNDPESGVVISEERTESSDGGAGGTSESSVTNYEFDKTIENIAGEVGNIERLSVAVMVDGKYETEGEGENATKRFVPRSDEELAKIASIVKSAVGFDDMRNDYFEIASIAFDRSYLADEEQGMEKMLRMQFYLSIARKGAYLAGLVFALIMILKMIKKVAGIIGAASYSSVNLTVGGESRKGVSEAGDVEATRIAAQIARLAERNPDQAAGVISSMVEGGK